MDVAGPTYNSACLIGVAQIPASFDTMLDLTFVACGSQHNLFRGVIFRESLLPIEDAGTFKFR